MRVKEKVNGTQTKDVKRRENEIAVDSVTRELGQVTPEEREILKALEQEGITTPSWLVAKLHVIPSKMRKTLESLEQRGLVFVRSDQRVAGGKVAMLSTTALLLIRYENALGQD